VLTPTQQLRYDQQAAFNKNSQKVLDKDADCPYWQSAKQEATDHIISVQRTQQAIEAGNITREEALKLLPSPENLTGSCTSCNSSKGGKPLATDPSNVRPGEWEAPAPTNEILDRAKDLKDRLKHE
jgi:5-methylcytosine-specific restriction endonuclease McrA